jgi:flagellar motility protein MotE (MotC chaperone)
MSLVKTALIVLGGGGLFAGSFLGFSLASGHSLKDLPLLRKFSNEPATATIQMPVHSEEDDAAPADEKSTDKQKPPGQPAKTPGMASVLGAFVLPAPFSSEELGDMQSRLAARLAEVETSLAAAKKKEQDLDDRERALLGRETELQRLKTEVDMRSRELSMREMEIKRDTDAANAVEKQSWVEVARFFQDGEPEELSKKLATFDPDNAARILRQLDDERAIAIVNALPPDKYKTFLDAYRKNPR